MREILFRGKRLDNGEWVEGFYVCLHDHKGNESHRIYTGYAETDCGDYYPEWFEVDPSTVCQFTGLLDKNGKRIFEGDLLNWFSYPFLRDNAHNYFAEVVWFENSPAFGLVTHKNPLSAVRGISAGNADYMEDFDESDWEIIGNIHDNPELMGVTPNE